MPRDIVIAWITCPDQHAATLADALVERRLAACVNIVPGLKSVFHWEGRIRHEGESLLLAKTTATGFGALSAAIQELHPYELPEIIAVPVVDGLPEYLQWVADAVN